MNCYSTSLHYIQLKLERVSERDRERERHNHRKSSKIKIIDGWSKDEVKHTDERNSENGREDKTS